MGLEHSLTFRYPTPFPVLAELIVVSLIGKDAVIVLSGDDTLCRKRGLGVFGTGMHHDPLSSSKSKKICHWGHDWVD